MTEGETKSLTIRKRQCWECLRRQIPCDAAHPVCKACADSGIVCPGYEDRQPLRWLTPGKVTSRSRKKGLRPSKSSDGTTSRSTRKGQGVSSDCLVPATYVAGQGAKVPSLSRIVLEVDTDAMFEAVQYCQSSTYCFPGRSSPFLLRANAEVPSQRRDLSAIRNGSPSCSSAMANPYTLG